MLTSIPPPPTMIQNIVRQIEFRNARAPFLKNRQFDLQLCGHLKGCRSGLGKRLALTRPGLHLTGVSHY